MNKYVKVCILAIHLTKTLILKESSKKFPMSSASLSVDGAYPVSLRKTDVKEPKEYIIFHLTTVTEFLKKRVKNKLYILD